MAELSLEHASFLAEHLSPHASVWKKLGTALKFRQQDLDNIQGCLPLMNDSPYSYMQRLVEEWLEGKYPHTAPPTLANLLKALNSHTVGLGRLATQIRDSLPQHDLSLDAKIFEIASVSDQGDILFHKNEDIKVCENTCIYLKVEITGGRKARQYVWETVGLVPIHDKLHLNVKSSALYISKASIDMDGSEYSCSLNWNIAKWEQILGEKNLLVLRTQQLHVTTTPVTLRVSCSQLDQFKESLASIYLAQPEVPQDSWPPVSNKTYINLALIKQQAINYGEEYARLTIRGDMDDVLHHKEKIEYKNIFDELRSGSLLLIEGRPGSGKTTFVHKITRDWAVSEVQGPRRLVLLVSLRVLNGWEKPVSLKDILLLLKMRVSPTVLEERNGKGVCFIFDGLDEFSPLEGENSVVYEIIDKTYLPQSIVIVASRPAALVKLRQRANKVIEVIGFPKNQIFEYFMNYPFSNTSKPKELKSYLLSHPNVLHMCYLPIHAAMVAFLFEVMGKVPHTETEIYKHFTRFTLMRSLSKHKGQNELEDIDTGKLSGEEKELFDTICEFALEKTISKKQVLDQSEVKLRLQGKGCKDISLGLVTVDRTAGLYGFKNIYTFLHLTYQEYLAAYYISTLSDKDQHKLIKQYGDTDHMQVVWKFYCGLVNFEGHEYKIKALVSEKRENINLFVIQCAYESQQEIVCKCIMKEMDARIVLEDKYLATTDFTALGYLFAKSSMPTLLSLTNCKMNTKAVSALLKETEGKPLCLRELLYKSHDIDLKSLTKLLQHQHSLECLKVSYTSSYTSSLTYPNFSNIASTSLANLKELSLTNVRVTLSSVLHSCKRLICLILNNSIEDYHIEPLTEVPKLEKLEIISSSHTSLDFSNIVSTSLANLKELSLTNVRVKLSSLLQVCQTLTSLILKDSIDRCSIEPLIKASKLENLEVVSCSDTQGKDTWSICITRTGVDFDEVPLPASQCTMLYVQGDRENYLQTLKLEVASISTSDLEFFREYWPTTPKLLALQQVVLSDHKVMLKIIEFVSDFSALEKLILRSVAIDATFLAGILKCCVMLQELELSHGWTLSSAFTPIFISLKNCSKLQKLKFNDSSYINTCFLASCLQHWPKLQELHLRGCGIEEEGAKAIADNIKYCPKLTEVHLSGNNISNETLQMIKSSLQSHNEVTESSSPSHNEVTKSSLQSHNEVTESSSPSHNEVTKSSSPSHNEVTKSSSPSHNEVTKSSSPSHNEVTESSSPSHNEVTKSSSPSYNEVTESSSPSHNEVTKSSSPSHNEVTKSSSPSHNEVTESSSPSHNEVTKSSSPSHNEVTESSSPSHNEVIKTSSPSHNTCCCTLL